MQNIYPIYFSLGSIIICTMTRVFYNKNFLPTSLQHTHTHTHIRMPLQAKSSRVQLVRDALNEILK